MPSRSSPRLEQPRAHSEAEQNGSGSSGVRAGLPARCCAAKEPLPSPKIFSGIKKNRGKMIYTKALHKKVINANSSEKIAPTDGINPFPANASGCADGNYRMYVNTQALGSTATRTAEFRHCRGMPARPFLGPLARRKLGPGKVSHHIYTLTLLPAPKDCKSCPQTPSREDL